MYYPQDDCFLFWILDFGFRILDCLLQQNQVIEEAATAGTAVTSSIKQTGSNQTNPKGIYKAFSSILMCEACESHFTIKVKQMETKLRTFFPPVREMRPQVSVDTGVAAANNHTILADTEIAMEPKKTRDTEEVEIKRATLGEALATRDIPIFFANDFGLIHTDSDSALLFLQYGRPVALIQFSSTLLKEIAKKTGTAIEDMETVLGSPVPEIKDLQRFREYITIKQQAENDVAHSDDHDANADNVPNDATDE